MHRPVFQAVLFTWLFLFAYAATASETPGMGGRDLPAQRQICAANERMTGADFRYGHWVDSVKIICTPFSADGRACGAKRVLARTGGNGGDFNIISECAQDSWVAGATALSIEQMALNGEKGVRDYVARVRLACMDTRNVRSDLSETSPVTNYGYITHRAGCPANMAAVGFDIHGDGRWVTGLGLVCEARSGLKSMALASLPAAASSFAERIPWPGQSTAPVAASAGSTSTVASANKAADQDQKAQGNAALVKAQTYPYGSVESIAAFEQAAALGNVYARGLIGHLYCEGKYKAKDERRCFSIYLLLAEEGEAQYQLKVGRLYKLGVGTPVDIHAARYWFERASNQGDATAMFNLAAIYNP